MANSLTLDKTDTLEELFDLGLHYLLLPYYENTNILKIVPPKNENFQIKVLMFFIFLLKT